ncbi:MAG: hypothetical protein JWM47_773 [Acidimicrobiales bacterium]|nr:hypothetical protein [Acidimicrobiales bacterium]
MTLTDPTAKRARAAKPRGAKVLLILGGVLLVIGLVLGQWGIQRLTGAVRDIRNSGDDVRNGLLVEVEVPGDGDVELRPGRYDVFVIRPQAPGFDPTTTTTTTPPVVTDGSSQPEDLYPGYDEPTVEITGPGGARVPLRSPGIESTFIATTGELLAIHTFTVTEAGSYHVEAIGTGADKVGVGPTVDNGNVGRLARGGIIGVLGYLGAALGFVLALSGLIWLLVAGDSRSKPPPGYYGPGPAGPWGAPPGQWGPPPGPSGPAGPWAQQYGPPGPWGPPPGTPPPTPAATWPPGPGPRPGWAPPTDPRAGQPPPPPPPSGLAPPPLPPADMAPPPLPGAGPPVPPTMTPPAASPWGDGPPTTPDARPWSAGRPPDEPGRGA